jgi:hypothetical protein
MVSYESNWDLFSSNKGEEFTNKIESVDSNILPQMRAECAQFKQNEISVPMNRVEIMK